MTSEPLDEHIGHDRYVYLAEMADLLKEGGADEWLLREEMVLCNSRCVPPLTEDELGSLY